MSKASQLPVSSALKDEEGAINSMSDEGQETELTTNGSCSPGGGVAGRTEGSDCDQDYGDEETDSGDDCEERDGSHDGAEFSTAAADDDDNDDIIDTDVANTEGGAGAGVKKVKIPGLYKPPTHDELQTLRETQNLFKSNLLRLQVHNTTWKKFSNVQP